MNGQCVSKTRTLRSVSGNLKPIFNSVGQTGRRVPIGVVFKIGKIRVQEHPHAAHDGDDHRQEHDHTQDFADGALIVGSTKDGLSGGASVHKVNTTPYHLGIHLERW